MLKILIYFIYFIYCNRTYIAQLRRALAADTFPSNISMNKIRLIPRINTIENIPHYNFR